MEDAGGLVGLRRPEKGRANLGLSLDTGPGKPGLFAGEKVGGREELGDFDRKADRRHEPAVPPHFVDPHGRNDLLDSLLHRQDGPVHSGFALLLRIGFGPLRGDKDRFEHEEGAHGVRPHRKIKDEVVEVPERAAVDDDGEGPSQVRGARSHGGASKGPVDRRDGQGGLDPDPARSKGGTVVDDEDLGPGAGGVDRCAAQRLQGLPEARSLFPCRIQDPDGVAGEIPGQILEEIGAVFFCQGPVAVGGNGGLRQMSAQEDGQGDVESLWNANRLSEVGTGAQDDPGRKMLHLPFPVDGRIGDDCHAFLEVVRNVLSFGIERGQGAVETQGADGIHPDRRHPRENVQIFRREAEGVPESLDRTVEG